MLNKILLTTATLAGIASSYDALREDAFQNSTIDQKLDHFSTTETRTFKQRYFWNDYYWDSKTQAGPIFLYICGEGTCKPPSERGFPFQIC
jgi:hypothetical protein